MKVEKLVSIVRKMLVSKVSSPHLSTFSSFLIRTTAYVCNLFIAHACFRRLSFASRTYRWRSRSSLSHWTISIRPGKLRSSKFLLRVRSANSFQGMKKKRRREEERRGERREQDERRRKRIEGGRGKVDRIRKLRRLASSFACRKCNSILNMRSEVLKSRDK